MWTVFKHPYLRRRLRSLIARATRSRKEIEGLNKRALLGFIGSSVFAATAAIFGTAAAAEAQPVEPGPGDGFVDTCGVIGVFTAYSKIVGTSAAGVPIKQQSHDKEVSGRAAVCDTNIVPRGKYTLYVFVQDANGYGPAREVFEQSWSTTYDGGKDRKTTIYLNGGYWNTTHSWSDVPTGV